MFLRNHGVVCVGETIEEAFSALYHVVKACEVQVSCIFDSAIKKVENSRASKERSRLSSKVKWPLLGGGHHLEGVGRYSEGGGRYYLVYFTSNQIFVFSLW